MIECGMSPCINALLIAVLPLLAGFLGFYLNHRFELQRQKIQQAYDHEMQGRQTRRTLLEQLQYALAAVKDGSETAMIFLFAEGASGVDAARATLEAPWYQDWQTAAQKVSVLSAQLGDDDLKIAAREVGLQVDRAVAARGDLGAFNDARTRLNSSYVLANERAGQLIHDIDASAPVITDARRDVRETPFGQPPLSR